MPDVILGPYNTIAITAGTVYRLKGVQGFTRPVDLLNLGAGSIFVRADTDPTIVDSYSLKIPPNSSFNALIVDARIGLGVIADANTTISVKVT